MSGEHVRNRSNEDEQLDGGARPDFDESLVRQELLPEEEGFSTRSLYEREGRPPHFDMDYLRHGDNSEEERREVH